VCSLSLPFHYRILEFHQILHFAQIYDFLMRTEESYLSTEKKKIEKRAQSAKYIYICSIFSLQFFFFGGGGEGVSMK